MVTQFDVLIVGAGHAGAQAAIMLRQLKFDGTIGLIGAEAELPYERPPLSKDYLAGDKPFERLLIRQAPFWAERSVAMMLGRRVVAVKADAHEVVLSDGAAIAYGTLVWATGGLPRRLACEGNAAIDVHAIRRRDDVDAVMAALPAVDHVIIVGGGYIGLEAAAVMTKLGKRVTVLEAMDRVLARVAGPELSAFFEAEHRAHGVDLRTEVAIHCIETENGRATGVRLADGSVIAGDLIIVGIGIVPEVEPLIVAGAHGDNGVDVDSLCRTSLADVYAIGDCAAHINPYADGRRIRLESVQNANDQANLVAQHIIGKAADPYDAVPWFWSNQYDLKLQTVGLSLGYDETIVRGATASRSFSVIYLRQGRVIALDCVNAVKDYVQGRAHVVAGTQIDVSQAADPSVPLRDVLNATTGSQD